MSDKTIVDKNVESSFDKVKEKVVLDYLDQMKKEAKKTEGKITKSNLNKAKEIIVLEYLNEMRNEANETTKRVFEQFEKINFGYVPTKEEMDAKRNRK